MAAQANRVMSLGEWEEKWQKGTTGFHQSHVHRMLESNLQKVVAERQQVRFFFPLCGKAVDMKWLADMGHIIVGVEICEKGIKQFFEEQGLQYTEEPVEAIPGTKVFKSSDRRISIYQCDLYKFSSAIEGQFGGIWDRGSLVAINPCDRQRYATLMMSLMEKNCRYLLDTLEYNPELHRGPPFLVPEEVLKKIYGESCEIELVQTGDAFEERHKEWGIDSLLEKVYLLTLKAK
ncbi:probable thiopurine S-methyltransferase [Electrophorus electricus]|uniref:thiopurine S-methyltransferase n=1 Tax=Electrophorus electricus TaxID=8005 RepID=A0A4W4EUJ3_ELEEL|nr:probable thiopurine S-methyltransferase [Electrophorus electricus]